MEYFHREEALVFKKRLLSQLGKELAFRVGSVYHQAVLWCLTYADHVIVKSSADEDVTHPALEFYNNVVAPLDRLVI
jgi:hypothetical protein